MKKNAIVAGVVVALAGFILWWHFTHLPQPDDATYDFDQFQADMAARVLKQFGANANNDSFTVAVVAADFPIGTLFDPDVWVPADAKDCIPATPPSSYSAQHLFPSYNFSADTVATANLGLGAAQGMVGALAKAEHSSTIQYAIDGAQVSILDDKSVQVLTGSGDCNGYIASHPGVRMIRGFVSGKLNFAVKVDNPASVAATVPNTGSVSVSDDPDAKTVSIADQQMQQIVQLITVLRPATQPALNEHPAAQPTAPPAPPAAVGHHSVPAVNSERLSLTAPASAKPPVALALAPVTKQVEAPNSTPTSAAHIFVQQDANDDPQAGAKIVQLLRAGWPNANVETRVQQVVDSRMPGAPQVRFFNATDADAARKCLEIFKQTYPSATIVRIGLPSPKGQLEVWLPKKGV